MADDVREQRMGKFRCPVHGDFEVPPPADHPAALCVRVDGEVGNGIDSCGRIAANVALMDLVDQNKALMRRIRDLSGGEHARALAMMTWFAARGANNAGQWPGDPKGFEKQNQAREDFDKWWGPM